MEACYANWACDDQFDRIISRDLQKEVGGSVLRHPDDVLLDASRPVLRRLMRDCQPALVIVAGVDGFRAFEETLRRTLQVQRALSRGGSGGVYQWAAYATTCDGHAVTIAQVPYFSRANSRARLEECGRWLGGLVEAAS